MQQIKNPISLYRWAVAFEGLLLPSLKCTGEKSASASPLPPSPL